MYSLEECLKEFEKIRYKLTKHDETENYEYFEFEKMVDYKIYENNNVKIQKWPQWIKVIQNRNDSPLYIGYSKIDRDYDPVLITEEEAKAIYMLHYYLEC